MSYVLVVVESPYSPTAGVKPVGSCSGCSEPPHYIQCEFCSKMSAWVAQLRKNIDYARAAMKDCLMRGEAPYASHLLYTQDGVLDDTVPAERDHGIKAGFAWRQVAQKTVVYTDLGITRGMEFGILDAQKRGCPIEMRSLPEWVGK